MAILGGGSIFYERGTPVGLGVDNLSGVGAGSGLEFDIIDWG